MKKTKSMLGILALLLVFAFTACDNSTTSNDDCLFANTTWVGEDTIIRFTSTTEWEGQANPSLRGRFEVEDNVAHLTVTHKDGSLVNGTGSVTIHNRNGIIIVVIVITIGGENIVDDEAIQAPNDFDNESTFRKIQGIWRDGINTFVITANQASMFNVMVYRTMLLTSFIISESDRLNIETLDEIPFQLLFFHPEDFQLIGRISGLWVDDDGNFQNQRLDITERVVEQHALSSNIPNIGVYHRNDFWQSP